MKLLLIFGYSLGQVLVPALENITSIIPATTTVTATTTILTTIVEITTTTVNTATRTRTRLIQPTEKTDLKQQPTQKINMLYVGLIFGGIVLVAILGIYVFRKTIISKSNNFKNRIKHRPQSSFNGLFGQGTPKVQQVPKLFGDEPSFNTRFGYEQDTNFTNNGQYLPENQQNNVQIDGQKYSVPKFGQYNDKANAEYEE